jgi:iron complex outermembrane receptor protein
VNGVINIITKSAKDTKGGFVTAGAGNYETGFGTARYGGMLKNGINYRGYIKYNDREELDSAVHSNDDWRKTQTGFRMDWDETAVDNFTLQGDLYDGREGYPATVPSLTTGSTRYNETDKVTGANILGRWNRNISNDSSITLQMYIDHVERDNAQLGYVNDIYDIDFQHTWTGFKRQEIIWGLGYRLLKDDIRDSFIINFGNKLQRNDQLFSGFFQDKIALVEKEWFLTLGSKFEQNDYSGFEIEPSAKLSWIINDRQTLWSSVSRAVRTPNRGNSDAQLAAQAFPAGTLNPTYPVVIGQGSSPDLESEELIAYELGYRIQPADNLSFDISTFYNQYEKEFAGVLGTGSLTSYNGVPYIFTPINTINLGKPTAAGIELATNWEVNKKWQLAFGYNYIDFNFDTPSAGGTNVGRTPRHQFDVRSYYNLPYNMEFDTALYYVAPLQAININGYYRLDARLGWQPLSYLDVSLVGQNLLKPRHTEFSPFIYNSSADVNRSVYAQATVHF